MKREIRGLLEGEAEWEAVFRRIDEFPPRQAVNPLFACFYDRSSRVKWRAVAAMGRTVARLAEQNLESARVVMRRLIWNLNDESGGIGWGSPEAMAEIMARHPRLAEEYAPLLCSYVKREQNFLEHDGLQRGALWGAARLARVRPGMVADAAEDLALSLHSADPYHRGYAAWALGCLQYSPAAVRIDELRSDPSQIEIFRDMELSTVTVGRLAEEARSAISDGEC
jgi:hypothetical protein